MEPYRFRLDTCGTLLAGILAARATEGIDVRIILDKSANTKEDRAALKGLRSVGAKVNVFHQPAFFLDYHFPSLATHRDHRKLTLLDGKTALVGSRNIQDKYFFDWHDVDFRVTGPVVADLTRAFRRQQRLVAPRAEDPYVDPDLAAAARADTVPGKPQYFDVTMQVVPETPADRKLPIRNAFEWAIGHAKSRMRPAAAWTSAGSSRASTTWARKRAWRSPCTTVSWPPASASTSGRSTRCTPSST